jgi:predicted Zn-dependent protease with MMP-like domain
MSSFQFTLTGEALKGHDTADGAIAGYVRDVTTGTDAASVTVSADALAEAVRSDLADSYPTVHVHADGETVAVTDHRKPTAEAAADALGEFGAVDVVRLPAVATGDDAQRVLVDREAVADATAAVDGDAVTVHVETGYPLVVAGATETVAVAPQLRPGEAPEGVSGHA